MDNKDMAIKKNILLLALTALCILLSCSRDKGEEPMIDMEAIKSDGSHNQMYIFRKELGKEERQKNRYKSDKNKF
jgi:hypothetical protein